jgi:hypothetical protein
LHQYTAFAESREAQLRAQVSESAILTVNKSSSSTSGLIGSNLQFPLDQAVKIIENLKGVQFRAVNA